MRVAFVIRGEGDEVVEIYVHCCGGFVRGRVEGIEDGGGSAAGG